MTNYELLYVLNPEIGEENFEAKTQKFQDLITASGTFQDSDVWGTRSLAYEIEGHREGYYVLVHFSSEGDFPAELERQLKIDDSVIRYLITKVEA